VLIVVALVLALLIKSFVIQAFYIPSASMQNTLEIGDRVLINKIVFHTRPIHRGDIIVFDGTGSWDFDNTPASTNIFRKGLDELEASSASATTRPSTSSASSGCPATTCPAPPQRQPVCRRSAAQRELLPVPRQRACDGTFSIVVPPGRLWVEGDHRAVSYDSRGHTGDPGGGTIPESAVLAGPS